MSSFLILGILREKSLEEKVQKTVEVPQVQHTDRIPQRTAEPVMDIPVPQVVEEIVEVFLVFLKTVFNSGWWNRSLRLQQFPLLRRSWKHPKSKCRRRPLVCQL